MSQAPQRRPIGVRQPARPGPCARLQRGMVAPPNADRSWVAVVKPGTTRLRPTAAGFDRRQAAGDGGGLRRPATATLLRAAVARKPVANRVSNGKANGENDTGLDHIRVVPGGMVKIIFVILATARNRGTKKPRPFDRGYALPVGAQRKPTCELYGLSLTAA